MKHMLKLKMILIVGIALVAMVLLGTKVQATEVTEQDLQSILDLIPNTMNLDIKEVEYEKATELIGKQIEQALKNNAIEYSKTENGNIKLTNKTINGQNVEIHFWNTQIYLCVNSVNNFYTAAISVGVNFNNGNSPKKEKSIQIAFNNHSQYNSDDETYVKNLKIESPHYYEVALDYKADYNSYEIAETYYNKLINDKSITIKVDSGQGDGDGLSWWQDRSIAIFKNNVLYDIRGIGNGEEYIPVMKIPNTVTDEKLERYILDTLNTYYKNYSKVWDYGADFVDKLKIVKGTDNTNVFRANISNLADSYTVYADNYIIGGIIARREPTTTAITSTDNKTNIKLDTNTNIVPAGTTLKAQTITTGNVLNVVKESLKTVASKYVAYDISLISNGAKVQPNGKVKISIPIPKDYNTSKLVVYRIADDGAKTEYKVSVQNNYAVFETNHFSTYVLAELAEQEQPTPTTPTTPSTEPTTPSTTEPVEQTTPTTPTETTKPEHKKDETPKTGTHNIITITSSILGIVSLAGIAIIKKF